MFISFSKRYAMAGWYITFVHWLLLLVWIPQPPPTKVSNPFKYNKQKNAIIKRNIHNNLWIRFSLMVILLFISILLLLLYSLYIYIFSFNNTVYFMSNLINYFHEYLFASLPYSMDLIIIIIIICSYFLLFFKFYKDCIISSQENGRRRIALFIRI